MTIDVLKFLSLFILLVLATISVAVSIYGIMAAISKGIEAMYKYGLLALFFTLILELAIYSYNFTLEKLCIE